MKATRRALAVAAGAVAVVGGSGTAAFAQTHIVPTITPVRTDGGWIYWLAFLSLALGLLLLLILVAAYMRFAPRFSKDEDQAKVVRADRVLPGRDAPRRLVDVTQAVPVVAQPPAVVAAAPVAEPAAQAPPAAPAPAAAAPAAAAPAAEAPAAAPPADPAAPVPAAPAAAAAPAAPAPPAERAEVSLDQEVYEQTLQELLASGTDRRIAEGKAKRTAMIAARKKAEG
jgi:flagellar biogenesis protein FliO